MSIRTGKINSITIDGHIIALKNENLNNNFVDLKPEMNENNSLFRNFKLKREIMRRRLQRLLDGIVTQVKHNNFIFELNSENENEIIMKMELVKKNENKS